MTGLHDILALDGDDRGVSEVIGSILVFGVLVAMLTLVQTQLIPQANAEVELDHSQDVERDLLGLHATMSDVAADGRVKSATVKTGMGYPPRLLFVNPPRVQGTLETSESSIVELRNVQAPNGEVNDYFNDQGNTLQLDSRTLSYSVEYNRLPMAPTTRHEYGVLFTQYEDGLTVQNPGSVVDGNNINLVFMAGEYSETTATTQSMTVHPNSGPARTVQITGTSGNDVHLELPTQMPVSQWRELYGSDVKAVENVVGQDKVRLVLDGTETYRLQMSRIALSKGVQSPEHEYIVPLGNGVRGIGQGQTTTVEFEVRDQYNNPVGGVEVEIVNTATGNPVGGPQTTDDQGRVSASVTPGSTTTYEARITSSCSATSPCTASYEVQVASPPSLNLNPASGVVVTDSTTSDPLDLGGITGIGVVSSEVATVTMENRAPGGGSVGIDQIRINHYNPDPDGHSPVEMVDDDGDSITLDVGGPLVSASSLDPVSSSGTSYGFGFNSPVNNEHYFVMTVVYDNGQRAIYFVSP